jgi:precorrin-6B methylase 2
MSSSGTSKAAVRIVPASKRIAVTLPLAQAGVGLFLLSAASLAFEVTLTHLFSLVFQYHFAFLAVSSAILGLGVGGALSYRLAPAPIEKIQGWLSLAAGLVALAIPLAVVLFAMIGFMPGIILQAVVGALPFAAVGLFSARLYAFYFEKAAWLYAFDLGGAAFGLLGIQLLLNWMSAASASFVLGLLAAGASLLVAGRTHSEEGRTHRSAPTLPIAAVVVAVLGLGLNLASGIFDLPTAFLTSIPPDKTMFTLLADPTSGSKLLSSAWSSFARVDLLSSSDPNQEFIFTNGGAGSYMIHFNGDLSKVQALTQQLEFLPFDQFKADKTLILGAGAGKDVVQALLAGSKQITAVEINPAMVALTRQNGAYNGNIFDYPGVQTVVGDARSYVDRSTDTYNMIYLNLVYAQAPTPGSNALSESYIFTTEAFQAYWQHLAPGGRLGIIAHQGLEGSRALLTALKALELEGMSINDALQHTALLMYNGSDPNQNTTVMVLQKSTFTLSQVQLFEAAATTLNLQPLFIPGAYQSLLQNLISGASTLDSYVANQDYNLFPTTDERPFFFAIDPGIPAPLVTLLVVGLVGAGLYLLLMIGGVHKPSPWQMVYFGGLGLGFMLVEVPLIQRTLLLVGSPTEAMAVVLVSLLLGGGLGSFVSGRWRTEHLWPRVALAGALVALLAAALAIWQPAIIAALGNFDAFGRTVLGGLMLAPLGFVMGIPFANGLRLAGSAAPRSTAESATPRNTAGLTADRSGSLPYLWGWNALTSVLGSAVAAVLAMAVGFWAAMLVGAAFYALVTMAALAMGRRSGA